VLSQIGQIKNKKLTVSESRLRFSKVLDLQKLTGRLLRTLDIVGRRSFQSTFWYKAKGWNKRAQEHYCPFFQFRILPELS